MVNCGTVDEKTRWRMRTMNQRWKKNAPSNRRNDYPKRFDKRWRGGPRGGFGYPAYGRQFQPHILNNNQNNNVQNNRNDNNPRAGN